MVLITSAMIFGPWTDGRLRLLWNATPMKLRIWKIFFRRMSNIRFFYFEIVLIIVPGLINLQRINLTFFSFFDIIVL